MVWAHKYEVYVITPENGWYLDCAVNLVESIRKLNITTYLVHAHSSTTQGSICFYLSYPYIVPVNVINNSYKSLVVHASKLPEGKGFSPWVWQIIEGQNTIPVCLFEMVEKMDAGPVIDIDYVSLSGNELLPEIRKSLAETINSLCVKYLNSKEEPQGVAQSGDESFYRRRNKDDSYLDINKTILEQFNLLRVVDNDQYPAYFKHKGQKYILRIERESS